MTVTSFKESSDNLLKRLDVSILPFPDKYFALPFLSCGAGIASLIICFVEIMAPSEAMETGFDFALAAIVLGVFAKRMEGRWTRIVLSGCIIGGLSMVFYFFCTISYHPGAANYIQRSSFDDYPYRSIGTAVDRFMSNPRWSASKFPGVEFGTLVELRGGVSFQGQPKEAIAQFFFDADTREFEMVALEIGGAPMNAYGMANFIDALMKK